MENDSKQIKSELGHIYGSRISKNGKWLNLTIAATLDGKPIRITCPVRIEDTSDKPRAEIGTGAQRYAAIYGIPVYESTPKQVVSADDDDMPF